MIWVKTVGTGIPSNSPMSEEQVEYGSAPAGGKFQTLSRSHHKMLQRMYRRDGEAPQQPPTMDRLEAQLAEVKALFKQEFGEDVDEEP
mmetsp:Transcript_84109/g.116218  ORF Transcript_84109/g.116218 Transcript_84109/m.116218 type:complete len:88 (-) Transcript_84109:294-557(-)